MAKVQQQEEGLTKEQIKEQKAAAKEAKKAEKEALKKKSLKAKKEKKGGPGKKLKETVSELKKVSWPSFGTVVKKTGVVLTVVVIFTIVLFGFDFVLGLLYDLFTKQL